MKTSTTHYPLRPTKRALAFLGCLSLVLASNCSFFSRVQVRAQFGERSGLRVGSEVYFASSSSEVELIGSVSRISELPHPTPFKKIEIVMTLNNKIEGQPWYQLIHTDSLVSRFDSLDYSKLIVRSSVIIKRGTDLGQPAQENSLLPVDEGFFLENID